MFAPIDHAWMFLKAAPTEREQRNMNEGMEPFDASMVDSRHPHMRGEQEPPEPEQLMDTQDIHEEAPDAQPPIDAAMQSLQRGGAPYDEGPTLAELNEMDDDEAEHHKREAGRRGAEPSDPAQRTLHDY